MEINYYLIHGIDKSRAPRMISEFDKAGIPKDKVNWILYPNKYDITPDLYKKIVMQEPSYSCGVYKGSSPVSLGVASCSYKHYLALQDFISSQAEYAVIMEDNMQFVNSINVADRLQIYIQQLNNLYPSWDILFDLNYGTPEYPIVEGVYVYPKSNEITEYGHGGTRCAQFYLLTKACATKLYNNYLPFNNAPDWWMNDLFRKLNIKSYWANPPAVDIWPHQSTA